MSRDENSLAHTVWNCKYHIVFAPKSDGVECYSKIRGKALFKIKIPYKYKSSILENLDAAFINERTLFPDLENTI